MEKQELKWFQKLGRIWTGIEKNAITEVKKINPNLGERELIDQTNNLLYHAMYAWFAKNAVLPPIQDKAEAIRIGYKQNPDFYSIVDKVTNLYAGVQWKIIVKNSKGKDEDFSDPEIEDWLESPNPDQCMREFENLYYMFYLALGDSMIYAPRLEVGNNKGKLTPIGMYVMPTQYVWIYSDGWMKPVNEYVINFNQGPNYHIPASDVIHVKMSNPEYINGNNFYGLSPIIVASDVVRMQLAGYAIAKSTYEQGFPAGLLTRKDLQAGDALGEEQLQNISSQLNSKYLGANRNNKIIPGAGDLHFEKMGFDSLKDLDVLEFLKHGTKRLSEMIGVPYVDKDSKFANMEEVKKTTINARVLPDKELHAQKFNIRLWRAYGNDAKRMRVVPDWSRVPELQADKQVMSTILKTAVDVGAKTPNDFNRAMGLEISDDPACDIHYINRNYVRLDDVALGEILPENNPNNPKPNNLDESKMFRVKLDKNLITFLQSKQETGMGYQIVDIEMISGKIYSEVKVLNCEIALMPEKIDVSQIKRINLN